MSHPSHAAPQAMPRLDLYAPIHKALRAWMFDTVLRVGRTDGVDAAVLQQTLSRVESLLLICEAHIHHEQVFLHPLLEQARHHAAREADQAHLDHAREIARLRDRVWQVREAGADMRGGALMTLYRELALFTAENLTHMHWEETVHNETLWASYPDAQLMQTHDALVQSIGAQEMAETLRHMLPALSPCERIGMLSDMRAKMPPGAFEGVLALAHEVLPVHDAAALLHGLGVQPPLPMSPAPAR